jgi:hypothetical protein
MDMSDAFVFDEPVVVAGRRAFGVKARDGLAQTAQLVATISKRDLRQQQNAEDDENY